MTNSRCLRVVRRKSQAGLGLVEVVAALSILTFATLGIMSSVLGAAGVDSDVRERTIALRAATSRMEAVLAYDHQGDLNNLITFIQQPGNSIFDVEGLDAPHPSALTPASLALVLPSATPTCGSIFIDATDPLRVQITLSVDWTGRFGQAKRLVLPMTLAPMGG